MKYLKRINETLNSDIQQCQEILEFTKNYLSYLLDYGYYFKVENELNSYDIRIAKPIQKQTHIENMSFEWDEISDYLIPYLIMLKNTYPAGIHQQREISINNYIYFQSVDTYKYLSYTKVLNDNYEKPKDITFIIIKVFKINI